MTTLFYSSMESLEAAYRAAQAREMSQAWRNALERGYDLLLQSDIILVEFDEQGRIHTADIPSQTQEDTVYTVNGHCSCQAAQRDRPCAHRAAKKLLQRAWERSRPNDKPAHEALPFAQVITEHDDLLKPEDETPEQAAQRVARKRSSVPMTAEQRTGVSREQAMREMAELFDY
jgi:hypothetical protein